VILPASLTIKLAAYPRKIPNGRQRQRMAMPVDAVWPTESDPDLPEHDKRASYPRRRHLRRVHGDTRVLHAEADAEDEAGREEALP
jgi:hypothetical protein